MCPRKVRLICQVRGLPSNRPCPRLALVAVPERHVCTQLTLVRPSALPRRCAAGRIACEWEGMGMHVQSTGTVDALLCLSARLLAFLPRLIALTPVQALRHTSNSAVAVAAAAASRAAMPSTPDRPVYVVSTAGWQHDPVDARTCTAMSMHALLI